MPSMVSMNRHLVVHFIPLNIFKPSLFYNTSLGFLSLCLMDSSIYVFKDILDVHHDRQHPCKRKHSVTSGDLQVAPAFIIACFLAVIALGFAFYLPWPFFLCFLAYMGVHIFYSLYLKKIPIVATSVLIALFLLRISSGIILWAIELSG